MALSRQPRFELGQRYRDTVSGWEGVADCVTVWLNGCVRYQLASHDKDGAPVAYVFDEEQIEAIPPVVPEVKVKAGRTGGPRDHAPMKRN